MATSPSSATKSTLLVLLLLSAVVTSQAHQVSCKNSWKEAVALNGVRTDVGVTTVLEVKDGIVVEVYEGKGVKHVGQFKCPKHVTALEFVHKGGGLLEAHVTDFSSLDSALQTGRRTLRGSVKNRDLVGDDVAVVDHAKVSTVISAAHFIPAGSVLVYHVGVGDSVSASVGADGGGGD